MKYRVPEWYRDAKLGIMIHWGPYTVPGYAPTDHGDLSEILRDHDWKWYFTHSPYAEWYANGLRLPESDTRRFHDKHFGRHVPYERFVRRFNEGLAGWEPESWAELFSEVGARYVVMVAKHHDGYLLWPSEHRRAESFAAPQDLVGLTAEAVRKRDLRFGVYYSGQLDWTFQSAPIADFRDLLLTPPSDEYAAYAERHFAELIERYQPDILWNDIGLPSGIRKRKLFKSYREAVPEGVLNDRWRQLSSTARRFIGSDRMIRRIAEQARRAIITGKASGGTGDVSTMEYAPAPGLQCKPWELVRGLGRSFGLNREEDAGHTTDGRSLISLLIDVVCRNGNLLINVGPDKDGTIPAVQRTPLSELGAWLAVNGAAIFDTRPWRQAEAVSPDGVPLRFTSAQDTLYVIALETPPGLRLEIPDVTPAAVAHTLGKTGNAYFDVSILGSERIIEWESRDGRMVINIPGSLRPTGPIVFRLRWMLPDREPDRFFTDII